MDAVRMRLARFMANDDSVKNWEWIEYMGQSQHLLLGISEAGMLGFLAHPSVGFLEMVEPNVGGGGRVAEETAVTIYTKNQSYTDGESDVSVSTNGTTSNPLSARDVSTGGTTARGSAGHSNAQWRYNANVYTTSPAVASARNEWVDKLMGGALSVDPNGKLTNTTGYDLQKFVQGWLKANGHSDKSVCEVILSDPRFTTLRDEVRKPPGVFWSHIQKEDFLSGTMGQMQKMINAGKLTKQELETGREASRESTLTRRMTAEGQREQRSASLASSSEGEDVYFWLDYFCLRQCLDDFKIHVVLGLVQKIGAIAVSIDSDFIYTTRSFCILEAYAGIANRGETKVIVNVEESNRDGKTESIAERLKSIPIRSESAKCKSEEHKLQIRDFITKGTFLYEPISYETIDEELTNGLLASFDEALEEEKVAAAI